MGRRLPSGLVAVAMFVVSAGVATASTTLWGKHRIDGLRHIALAASLGDPRSGTNYLIVGSDSRQGADPADPDFASIGSEGNVSGQRSDTMMVLHVEGSAVRLLSLPRDLYVSIPGFKSKQRINAAYSRSPATLVNTVRTALQIPVTHYFEIDFGGFKGLVDALDGVDLCLDKGMGDATTGFNIPEAGCHHINGVQALQWSRSRHMQIFEPGKPPVPDGTGDLGRIKRQQQFLKAVADRAIEETALDPTALGRIIDALKSDVVVDDSLGSAGLIELMRNLQAAGGGAIAAETYPGTNRIVNGASVLIPDTAAAASVIAAFR
jgi:LCP family protein required for cell wall assembly